LREGAPENKRRLQGPCESERIPVFHDFVHRTGLDASREASHDSGKRPHRRPGHLAPTVKRSVYNRPCLSPRPAQAQCGSCHAVTEPTHTKKRETRQA
jgi:hypothetical protein